MIYKPVGGGRKTKHKRRSDGIEIAAGGDGIDGTLVDEGSGCASKLMTFSQIWSGGCQWVAALALQQRALGNDVREGPGHLPSLRLLASWGAVAERRAAEGLSRCRLAVAPSALCFGAPFPKVLAS